MNNHVFGKIRAVLLVLWGILAVILLCFINHANVHVEYQKLGTIFVWAYMIGSIVVIWILAWLKRRLS